MSEQTQEPSAPAEEEAAHESEEVEGQQGEQEPPEAQALSQKQLEQALGKLEREAERHSKRVGEIMGSEVELLIVCPLCDPLTPGQIMPTPATPERFPKVREFMGDSQPRQLKPDPDAAQCEACGGEGLVDTGSHVQGQEALPCKRCDGFGWTGPRRQSTPVAPLATAPIPEDNGQATPIPAGPEPPEAAKLRALGYTLIQPVGAS
jgi:hypothetical protein